MDDGYPLVALGPLAGLAVEVVTHIAVAWLTGGRRIALSLLAGIAAGLLATAALTGAGFARMNPISLDAVALAAMNLAAYLALAYGYFNFVNLNMTSLRIRILLELRESPDGLTTAGLRELYRPDYLIQRRIDRLTAQGYLAEQDGRFRLRGRGLLHLARAITALKWVVLGHGNRTLQAALERKGRAS